MDEIAIHVTDVKKKFKIYYDKGNSLKDRLLFWSRNQYENHWVLNGISFSVKRGEAIGLMGRNGCGKSTTLKLLNRIMYPTSGDIQIRGRISSLIELGAGFHPDMTGRENIYTNASIFGMTKREIDQKIDQIIEFSELGEFIDNPVRTYSSGMYMRLGFSVAINVRADILLIDEILAVGDISFQKKCFEKLQEIKAQGVTIVIVSHSMDQIESICDKVIWLEQGEIKEIGSPAAVASHYTEAMERERLERENAVERELLSGGFSASSVRSGNGQVQYTSIALADEQGDGEKLQFETGSPLRVVLEYENRELLDEAVDFGVSFVRNDGLQCYGSSRMREGEPCKLKKKGTIIFAVDSLLLLPGKYHIDVTISRRDRTLLDSVCCAKEFRVTASGQEQGESGVVSLKHIWRDA